MLPAAELVFYNFLTKGVQKVTSNIFFIPRMGNTGDTTRVPTCLVDYKKVIKKYTRKSKTFNTCCVCISMEFTNTPPSKCDVRSIMKFLTAEECSASVARCTEKSVLIRIFEMIRIFIRKSANNTDIQR